MTKITQTKWARKQLGLPATPRQKVGNCLCGKNILASPGQRVRTDKCRHK